MQNQAHYYRVKLQLGLLESIRVSVVTSAIFPLQLQLRLGSSTHFVLTMRLYIVWFPCLLLYEQRINFDTMITKAVTKGPTQGPLAQMLLDQSVM